MSKKKTKNRQKYQKNPGLMTSENPGLMSYTVNKLCVPLYLVRHTMSCPWEIWWR